MGLVTFSDDAGNSRFASPQPLRTIERLSISIAQAFGQWFYHWNYGHTSTLYVVAQNQRTRRA